QKIPNKTQCVQKLEQLLSKEIKKGGDEFFDFLENLDRSLLVTLCARENNRILNDLLLQKDAVRMYFEKCLSIIQKEESMRELKDKSDRPTCFVCFALEKSVEDWLKKIFVPDLERTGVEPIFSPW